MYGLWRVLLIGIFYGLLVSSTALEICPEENCISSDKCEMETVMGRCDQQGVICCSLVKQEFRTRCRHHGGECMERCAPNLQRSVTDCPSSRVCCVLV